MLWPVMRPFAVVGLACRSGQARAAAQTMTDVPRYRDRLSALAVSRGWIVEIPDPIRRDRVLELAALINAQDRQGVSIATTHAGGVERLADLMMPAFERSGCPLVVLQDTDAFPTARASVGPLRRLAHDCLRDRILLDEPATPIRLATRRLRGRDVSVSLERRAPVVLLAEADRALLDEAKGAVAGGAALDQIFTPREGRRALAAAKALEQGKHWTLSPQPALTALGRSQISMAEDLDLPTETARRAYLVTLALTAQVGLLKERDYVIEAGELTIIDPKTGLPDPGRTWTSGVQQMVELQNGLPQTPVQRARAQISMGEVLDSVSMIGGVARDLDGAGREIHQRFHTPVWTAGRGRQAKQRFERDTSALINRLELYAKAGAIVITDRPELAKGLPHFGIEVAAQGLPEQAPLLVLADVTESRRTAATLSEKNGEAEVIECLSLDDPHFTGWRIAVLRRFWGVVPWRHQRAARLLASSRRRQRKLAARQRAGQADAALRRKRLLAFAERV